MDRPVPPAVSHKQLISRCLPGKGYTGPAPMTSKGRGEARTSALDSATHRIFPASIRLEIASSHDSLQEQAGFEPSAPSPSVNEGGRSHDVKNLFIVDGSIFVTSAGVNPTRTIQALALYIADSIKQRLATLFD
jgi:choline dehydrogenase-like flavoprotein